jgi:hypothetical protein
MYMPRLARVAAENADVGFGPGPSLRDALGTRCPGGNPLPPLLAQGAGDEMVHRALGSSHGNACWNAMATAKAGLLGNSPRCERPYSRSARIKSRVVTVSGGHDPKILFPFWSSQTERSCIAFL